MSQRIPTHRKMLKSALFDRRSFFLLELLITMTFQSFEAQLTQETKVASFFRGRPDPTASLSASLLHSRSCDRSQESKRLETCRRAIYNSWLLAFLPVLSLLVNDSNPGFDFDHFSTEKASQHAYYRVSQQVLDNLVNIEKRRKIRESLLTILRIFGQEFHKKASKMKSTKIRESLFTFLVNSADIPSI